MKAAGAFLAIILALVLLTSGCLGNGSSKEAQTTSSVPPISVDTPSSGSGGLSSQQPHSSGQFKIGSWAYWLQNASPEVIAESGFDLVVIDYSRDGSDETAYTREEIEKLRKAGVIPVAYLSIGEAEDYRFYWNESWAKNPPEWLGPENPEWEGNFAVKYWSDEWKRIVFAYLDKIIARGFSGVYLDKVDEFEYWSDKGYDENWTAREMIDFIIEIANYTRSKAGEDFLVIPQNGERLLEYDDGRLLKVVSGWASEDVFYDGLRPSPWRDEKISLLDRVAEAGKLVLVVDYVDDGTESPENMARIRDFVERARRGGYVPYAARADRELDELVVIPGVQPPTGR
ncbi:MJ1477/TM1410 family putative glycoside hydrolase [Thermococcus sp.]|uniref:MJ1477/TM1410 family putative glycoside hydrolase n=1 Tax=Thermococcus sp. TaxID=35749 RepID=UPI0026146120|nr:MJ1477/TM1410 family putative glycoside hydrolase [Thermococcus sp.]